MNRCLSAQEQAGANRSVISCQANCSRRTVFGCVKQRDNTGSGEVNIRLPGTEVVDNIAHFELHIPEVREQLSDPWALYRTRD
jgi:hypothetical protein